MAPVVRSAHDKCQFIEEPYDAKVSSTVLKTSGSREGLAEFNYLAGNNKNRLKDWGSWLCNQHSVGSGFELREAVRLTAYKHEIKIWGMSFKQIQRLAETDTRIAPPSRYHVASFPVAERLLAPEVETEVSEIVSLTLPSIEMDASTSSEVKLELAAEPEPQIFQVGSRVEVISDRHGVELVGQTGTVTAGTTAGAAVDVGGTLR